MIYLKTNLEITKEYSGTSKFDFFKKLSIGDIIEVKTNMEMYHFGYANDMILTIISGEFTGLTFKCTNGNFKNYMKKLGYKEYV